jgi:hypothetical protein
MESIDSAPTKNQDRHSETQEAIVGAQIDRIARSAKSAEIEACKDLWLAVLEQAVKDARGSRRHHSIVREAREWFRSEDEDPGSFLWVCRILRLDPDVVRGAVEGKYYYEAAWPLIGPTQYGGKTSDDRCGGRNTVPTTPL